MGEKVLNRKFVFPTNDQKIENLGLFASSDGKTLMFTGRRDGKDMKVPCGYKVWQKDRAPLFGGRLAQFPDEPTAGAFAWSSDDTCVIKLCSYETPFHTTVTLKFAGEQVTLDSETNVAFGPTKRPQLVGHAK